MTQQEKYFYWLDLQRRRWSLYLAVQSKITNIAKFIVAGGDPSTLPDYLYLVSEFGESVFESEVNRLRLMKEEDSNG